MGPEIKRRVFAHLCALFRYSSGERAERTGLKRLDFGSPIYPSREAYHSESNRLAPLVHFSLWEKPPQVAFPR